MPIVTDGYLQFGLHDRLGQVLHSMSLLYICNHCLHSSMTRCNINCDMALHIQ